jgi:hypothetical protein
MIREIITIDQPFINLRVPDEYVGQELELIVFVLNENIIEKKQKKAENCFSEFSAFQINTLDFKFNRDEANER